MEKKQKTIIDEMDEFRTCLIGFAVLRKRLMESKKLTSEEDKTLASLFDEISIDAGKYGPLIKEITGLETIHTSAGPQDIWNWALSTQTNRLVTDALDNCVSATSRTIGALYKDIDNGLRDHKTGKIIPLLEKTITKEKPKAFIAHEEETRALAMLKEFLEALGIQYFIAESKASNGRSIEKQVNWTQSKADFAICLATKGKAINKKTGKYYMGLNVADELGRARQVFGNKIILLVQKGVETHTNPREIIHETFTTTNMEKAFIKIARELTNWGFVTAQSLKELTS